MPIAVSSTNSAIIVARLASAPTTGRELLRWAEAQRALGPRGIAVGWAVFGWGCEMGFTSPVNEWDAEQVASVWSRAVLWLAETRLQEAGS